MPGGPDPIPSTAAVELGPWTQHVPLYYFDALDNPPGVDFLTFDWVSDPVYRGGGYCGATANNSYFTWLINLSPKGSIWHVFLRAAGSTDYGKLTIAFTSLAYESASRPSGDETGKIAPVDGSYGTFSYVDLATQECYTAGGFNENVVSGSFPFIVGGDVGDVLTDFTTGVTDPFTGFTLMDGGPGWYRIRAKVNGKHASSGGHKMRVTDLRVVRAADDNHP